MGNSLKVMLVDDEVTILEGFKRLFDWKAYGCEVVCEALDGVMAVNQAKLYQPDIIIMDINIPVMSGLEALRVIRDQNGECACVILPGGAATSDHGLYSEACGFRGVRKSD